MNANIYEIEISRVLCLLKELETGKPVDTNSSEWQGYHSMIYNKNYGSGDQYVAELCGKLKKIKNIKKYSLEMQIWWREHQKADAIRIKREKEQKAKEKLRKQALAKLSDEEKELLGLTK
jgi:hypothetical protein